MIALVLSIIGIGFFGVMGYIAFLENAPTVGILVWLGLGALIGVRW